MYHDNILIGKLLDTHSIESVRNRSSYLFTVLFILDLSFDFVFDYTFQIILLSGKTCMTKQAHVLIIRLLS